MILRRDASLVQTRTTANDSRLRTFAILRYSSVGLYSRPDFGDEGEPTGVAHLVIVELRNDRAEIGAPQMEQARGYARELRRKEMVETATKVTCFVVGSKRDAFEIEPAEQGHVRTQAITFETFIGKAEPEMLTSTVDSRTLPSSRR